MTVHSVLSSQRAGSLGPWTRESWDILFCGMINDKGDSLLLACKLSLQLIYLALAYTLEKTWRPWADYPGCLPAIGPTRSATTINSPITTSPLVSTICMYGKMTTESVYPVLRSRLDLRAKHLQQNRADWDNILTRFEEALKRVSAEGNEVSLNRHQSRGQLLRR